MQGTLARHGRWFCSERCAQEYARQQAARADACQVPARRRWTNPWLWVPLSGLLLATLGAFWPAAENVSASYRRYLHIVMLPFLAGLAIGGLVDQFVPKEYIVRLLAGAKKRVIGRAVLLGFLASTCSHGCLALAIELYRKGASVPAVIAFLLASPWASMALTLLLLALFGPQGLVFVIGALAIAFATGLIFQRLARRGAIEANPHTVAIEPDFSIRRDLAARWRAHDWSRAHLMDDARGTLRGAYALGRMVLGWVQLGLILSVVLGAFVPHHTFVHTFGPTPLGLLLTTLVATVIEVCSEGSAPLSFELFSHTGALGNAFAFLMAGVVTDYTELGALWTTIGRRTVGWLLAVALPLVFAAGLLLNAVGR
jgi:hypothetical protein